MAATDVVTLAEAKNYLNLTGTNAHDAELGVWITGVSRRLDKLVGPIVRRPVSAERHDGGGKTIFLRFYPNYSINGVTEWDGATATVLAAESPGVQPSAGYTADPYSPDSTLFSQRLRRRSAGADATFPTGRLNVLVDYTAGRFENTASVGADYKDAAGIMLKNLWRMQEVGNTRIGEFDVPAQNFPTYAVPKAVKELLCDELQNPGLLVG